MAAAEAAIVLPATTALSLPRFTITRICSPVVATPFELDDPHFAPYRSMRRLAHRGLHELGSQPESGNPVPRAAKARPNFEKICIRFDDGTCFTSTLMKISYCYYSKNIKDIILVPGRPLQNRGQGRLLSALEQVIRVR